MDRQRILKKLRKAKEGVSEIIANILILAITVTLFSSVMWYVGTMPAPTEEVYGDFDSLLTFENGAYPQISIMHKSGTTLQDFRTHIYIVVDGVTTTKFIRDGGLGDDWPIGAAWEYNATPLGITTDSLVEVLVYDYTVNSLIWSDILLGSEGNNPPVIMNRYVAIKVGSIWTQTGTVLQTQEVKVFAKVTDIDDDVSAVYANFTNLNLTDDMGWGAGVFKLNDTNDDGIFANEMSITIPVANNTGEKIIRISAVDAGGRTTTVNLQITIQSYTTGPPTILYAAMEPTTSIVGTQFVVRCYVTDPNNNLNKSSVFVRSDDNLATLGESNTTHAWPGSQAGVAASDPVKLRVDDDDFLEVPAGATAQVLGWITPPEMNGKTFNTVVLKVRYYTESGYDDTNDPKVNISNTGQAIPVMPWTTPTVRVYNLASLGYDTTTALSDLNITFVNTGDKTVYFDYWWLEVTYSVSPLDTFQLLREDPYNENHFVGIGLADYDVVGSNDVASATFYYTISASDYTGNEAQVRISHTGVSSDIRAGGGAGRGAPPGNLNYSGLQGFNIFELSDWTSKNYSATPRTDFLPSQDAVVVVASKYLVNTDTENTLLVLDPTTKVVVAEVSSPNVVFDRYDYNSGYYVYNATIDCSKLQNGKKYIVQVQLRDTWVPNNIFFSTELIAIGSVAYPTFKTYKDAAYTIPCDNFTTYDLSNNIIYVEVRNQYGGSWFQYGGDVEIRDFFWNAQIKRTPPTSGWNGPVSTVTQVGSSNVYRFQINLANATEGTPWIPGENAYALRYDMFKAGNESYVLSKIISVTAPRFKLDFVMGIQLPTGGAAWTESYTMFFYKNDNYWSPPDKLEGVNQDKDPILRAVLVRTGDMNNDGKNDIVAVVSDSKSGGLRTYYLFLYLNDGYWTRYTIADLGKTATPTVLELGNLDFDNDLDIILGFSTGRVCFYRNDGLWTYNIVDTSLTSAVNSLKVGDLDWKDTPGNDPNRSLDIAVCRQDGSVQIYKNSDGAGVSWTSFSRTGTATDVLDFAESDIRVYGVQGGQPTGTYLDTQNAYYDPGVYERLTEQWVRRYKDSTPNSKDATKDTTSEEPNQLRPNDGELYSVMYGQTAYINGWDPTGLIDDVQIESLKFKVRYQTYRYDGTDYVAWGIGSGDPSNNMMQIRDSGGPGFWIEDEFDLTGSFQWASQLIGLKVSFYNTYFLSDPSVVDFDYWVLNVTWKTGERLEHRWTFQLTPGTSHTFQVYASRSSAEDNFEFSYSTDNSTFTTMAAATVSSSTAAQYTAGIPAAVSGTVYIRVVDTNRASTATTLDYVNIFQMSIKTTAAGGAVGTVAKSLDIADMNGDGSNDLVVVGETSNKGRVWVGLNVGGDILPNLAMKISDNSDLAGCIDVYAGMLLGGNTLRDIAVATSSKVYIAEQTSGGVYALSARTFQVTGAALTQMVAGDVDGNGRTDILVGTDNGQVVLFSNYIGQTTGWQTYVIDSRGYRVNDIGLGKLQN